MTAAGERIAIGGLMRCDTETLYGRTEPGAEGEIQQCKYSDSPSHRSVFRDGIWRWVGPAPLHVEDGNGGEAA